MGSKVDKKAAKKAAKKAEAERIKKEAEAALKKAEELKKLAEAQSSSDDDSGSDSDSSSSSSSSEEKAKSKPETKVTPSSGSSSDSNSDSSSDEAEVKKVETTKEVVVEKKKVSPSSSSGSSSSSSSGSDSDSSDDDKEDDKGEKTADEKKRKEPETPSAPPAKKIKTDDDGDVEDSENCKVYIRGLPWKAEEYEVREFFKDCGAMATFDMPLMDDGRSSGTAVIEFESPDGSAAAVALNGQNFGERWLSIKYSTPKPVWAKREATPKPEGCVEIFMGNLSFNIDEDTVRDFFKDCGAISHIRFGEDRETGEFKGFGHVVFEDTDSTDLAVAKAGQEVMGRTIRLDYAARREPRFGGGGGGRGRGGGRGGRGRGRGGFGGRTPRGDGGGRGRGFGSAGRGSSAKKHGSIASFSGNKIKF